MSTKRKSSTRKKSPAPMAAMEGGDEPKPFAWSTANLAAVNTWSFLRALKQLRPSFENSKDIKMKELAYWNATTSGDLREITAGGLAAQIDKIYTQGLLARYEEGFEFHLAIDALKEKLLAEDDTLLQLAQTIDSIYHFRGE